MAAFVKGKALMSHASSWETVVNVIGVSSTLTRRLDASLTSVFGTCISTYPVVLDGPLMLKLRSLLVELKQSSVIVECMVTEKIFCG